MNARIRDTSPSDTKGTRIGEGLLTALGLATLVFQLVDVALDLGSYDRTIRIFPPAPYLLLGLCAVATVLRRRYPLPAVTAGCACWYLLGNPAVFALAIYSLGLRFPDSRRRAAPLVAAALAGATYVMVAHGPLVNSALLTVSCGALPLAIGLWVSARRGLLASLRQQLDQARQSGALEAAAARLTERSRIAGEMHDVLTHRVSLMVIHAGALEVSAAEPAVLERAALIRETGHLALSELRTVLGLLHASEDTALAPQPTLEQLDDLIQSSRLAGTEIRLVIKGTPIDLPTVVERTAYRIVQEALTNIHKHAPAASATVELRYGGSQLHVSVRNTPSDTPPATRFPRSGHGLVGLRERVTVLGGTLSTGPDQDGGFLLTATLPATNDPQALKGR